jgi:hypothetical protein
MQGGAGQPVKDGGAERAQPVTIISAVHRWWAPWLRLSWPGANLSPFIKRPLVRLGFIHIAHWSLVSRMPPNGRPRGARLAHPYVIFQSNFNDDLVAYIDAFALVVPGRIRGVWQGVFHFPGPQNVDRFVAFITERLSPKPDYYYCAVPDASSTMIRSALELDKRFRRFARETRRLDAGSFKARYDDFLAEVESLL